jgi:hypothetical protein
VRGFFIWQRGKLACQSRQIKKTEAAKPQGFLLVAHS